MITDLSTDEIFKRYHSDVLRVLPIRWRQKSTGIDM